jgi:type V secretory pathway adhesin AidA
MASSEKSSSPAPGRRGAKTGSNVAKRTIPAQLEADAPARVELEADAPADAPAKAAVEAAVPSTVAVEAAVPSAVAVEAAVPSAVAVEAAVPSTVAVEADAPATVDSGAGMPGPSFHPGVALNAWRLTLAPALRVQQEALNAIERFGRYHYSFAGDCLEWGLAQARASLVFGTPAEQVASQTTLAVQFGEKLQGRVREFVNLASDTRASFGNCWGK